MPSDCILPEQTVVSSQLEALLTEGQGLPATAVPDRQNYEASRQQAGTGEFSVSTISYIGFTLYLLLTTSLGFTVKPIIQKIFSKNI